METDNSDWLNLVACRLPEGVDAAGWTGLWFDSDFREARRVCRGCGVVERCLESAMREEAGERFRYGIRGGLSPKERFELEEVDRLSGA